MTYFGVFYFQLVLQLQVLRQHHHHRRQRHRVFRLQQQPGMNDDIFQTMFLEVSILLVLDLI